MTTAERAYGLLVWGNAGEDALRVGTHMPLAMIEALDALQDAAIEVPRLFRMWTPTGGQVVGAVWGDACALYVVRSKNGYATSVGDLGLSESFAVTDHDGRNLDVPRADCVMWSRARNALLNFLEHDNLGPEIATEGRIPSLLLMMGDIELADAMEQRANHQPTRRVAKTSLPRMKSSTIPMEVDEEEITNPVDVDGPPGPRRLR